MALRVLISLGVCLTVGGISLYVAWQDACAVSLGRFEQSHTQLYLGEIAVAAEDYRTEYHDSPRSINDLAKLTNYAWFTQRDNLVDGWHRPFIFSFDGSNFLAKSYGRDGKPGGVGLDCDLTTANPKPREARATFNQFLHNEPTRGMVSSSLACGALAFFLALFTIRTADFERYRLVSVILKLFATLVGATVVAVIITALHIPPSGH
jgi:hypothetical protein